MIQYTRVPTRTCSLGLEWTYRTICPDKTVSNDHVHYASENGMNIIWWRRPCHGTQSRALKEQPKKVTFGAGGVQLPLLLSPGIPLCICSAPLTNPSARRLRCLLFRDSENLGESLERERSNVHEVGFKA